MGSCISTSQQSSTVAPVTVPRPSKAQSFRLTQADLVKEKTNRILDDYIFVETLGKGGFGEVRKAKHKKTGIVRAVKVLHRLRHGVEQYEKILNEIQILKNLDHPHIMKIIEFYQDDAKLYIVTEFYEGNELFSKVSGRHSLEEYQVATIMNQILSAVNYCHKNKVVHRDLKPENIMYESKKDDAVLKVIDFGTSQAFQVGETLHKPLGTCYYVAPEVLKKEYNEKCDIWSCGVIMFFLLCGHPPFMGSTEKRILERVLLGHFDFDESEWAGITPGAKELIRKMLEYEPSKRISAEEALNDRWFTEILGRKEIKNHDQAAKNLKSIQKFRAEKKIQEAIWIFMVSFFSSKDDRSKLLETFKALDKDKNGTLSREEIKEGFREITGVDRTDEEIDDIMQKMDQNESGNIDYSEFVALTIDQMHLLSKSKLEAAFKLFDEDGNGYLTVDELKDFLSPERIKVVQIDKKEEESTEEFEKGLWEEMMNEVDANHDGKVSMQEFKELMLRLVKH